MAKAALKTQATGNDVPAFIDAIAEPRRREEARVLDAMHRRVTGCVPVLWGPTIIGYGSYSYRYDSGREGVMCRGGFSPRKAAATIYLTGIYGERQDEAETLLARLGKHSTGKSCLYIPRLDTVDAVALEALVTLSWELMNSRYPA